MKNKHTYKKCMNHICLMTKAITLCFIFATLTTQADIRIESSMPAEKNHKTSAAADGDRATWFQSTRPPRKGEFITVHLGSPQKLTSINVLTGTPDGNARFKNALLEVSSDGKTYLTATALKEGEANWKGNGKPVVSIRLRALKDGSSAVAIREIAMDDDILRRVVVTINGTAPFGRLTAKCNFTEGPGDYAVLMRDKLDVAASWFFSYYPKIVEMIDAPTDGLPRELKIQFRNDMKPGIPGYVSGGTMTLSIPHILRSPEDVRGLFIHELTHIAQSYSAPGHRPGWLVEGIAEAVRYKLSPTDDPWRQAVDRMDATKLDYHNAYRDTALFLLWIQSKNNPQLIAKLNRKLKNGSFTDKTFTSLTGKSPDTWQTEYHKAKGQ
jgi:hypothetical protein